MAAPIDTPRIPETSSWHGVEVTEDYRWLEDAAAAATVAWTAAQQRRTREYLDALPDRAALRARLAQLLSAHTTSYRELHGAGDTWFALKQEPNRQQPMLVTRSGLDDDAVERVVVDPQALDGSGQTTIDFFVPSPDGSRVVVSLSEHGSEDGTLFVYEVATGAVVDEPIAHANPAAAVPSVAWRHDGAGFWYGRADAAGFHQQVWFHRLGSSADVRERLDGFADPAIVENLLSASGDGRFVLDRAQRGDGGEWELFARSQSDADAAWWRVAGIEDRCVEATFAGDSLYLLSHADSEYGSVLRLRMTAGATVADATTVVPAGSRALTELAATDRTLWVADIDGGPCGLRRFGLDGAELPPVEIPPISTVSELAASGGTAVWAVESFTRPAQWWACRDGDTPARTALGTTGAVELTGYQVTREFATSADGTRVPMTVLAAPDAPRDGSRPALLTGYGGYAISLTPTFRPEVLAWLEQGGSYVVANLRGGGEYGERWHRQGRLAHKQNCFDDFIACADHLVATGITGRQRLAIMGGSNGGLLMGAVLTQRPDLARAVVAAVPVMDMLRVETTANGRYNVTEFGSVADPELFAVLRGYSPYHNVRDGARYPAVLLTGGEFDPRVDAWHPKKMAARLQAATGSGEPVLLRMESGGHGVGQSVGQKVDLVADYYAFLLNRLAVEYRPPR
ncbi:prolyl oligopeptidase family serine peptidase [Actinocatenispora sera]|uniref:prolyl oligopeptidase family serine peptidase n=1 Tax=Actinocatenispora sera TaxID=390989 RepID=UPI0033C265F3